MVLINKMNYVWFILLNLSVTITLLLGKQPQSLPYFSTTTVEAIVKPKCVWGGMWYPSNHSDTHAHVMVPVAYNFRMWINKLPIW